jgi:hypothetical protein
MTHLLIICATNFARCMKPFELKLKGRDHPKDPGIDGVVILDVM